MAWRERAKYACVYVDRGAWGGEKATIGNLDVESTWRVREGRGDKMGDARGVVDVGISRWVASGNVPSIVVDVGVLFCSALVFTESDFSS